MPGLLDDPKNYGLLSLGLRLMSTPGKFGTALGQSGLGALGDMQTAAQLQERRQSLDSRQKMDAQQMQMMQLQYEQAQEAQRKQQAMQALAQQFARSPQQNAMAANGGPTNAAAGAIPSTQPSFDFQGYSQALAGVDPMASMSMQQLLKKDDAPVMVPEGGSLFTKTGKPLAMGTPKADSVPSGIKEYQFAVQQGYKGTYDQWDTARKRAGASSVSVNTGQKGLDNTLKLRGDFRSEPVYKAHQEMQSAYAQIQQALKQASPAGDLAGATKVMKLLDPGSVVRESELGMAMAATGLLDRVQYYAENVIKGTKLNPTQRADFQKLADALYGESVKHYNAKRTEYEGIATRNGLSVPDVLGPQGVAPAGKVVDFGSLK